MEFYTKRLILRPWEETDAESLYEYAKNPEVGPIAGWPVHESVVDSLNIIRNVLSAEETYAVCLKEDGRAIGSVGLIPPMQSHTKASEDEIEIGYWIGEPFWGQGLIPEAVRRLQQHAFEDLGCSAIWCGYYDGNEKSRKCQEKCGFTYHHTEKEKPCTLMGDLRTEHFTKLKREDWEQNNCKAKQIAEAVNTLGDFCGRRDITELTKEALKEKYGISKADVFVLFGGSILAGGDVLAEAIRNEIAEKYIIVGGAGHTTETLRNKMQAECQGLTAVSMCEANLFQAYIEQKYGLRADYLECESTNCGNNITNLLALLEEKDIVCETIILCQDATMQRRMCAGLEKYRPQMQIVSYAAYHAVVGELNGHLEFASEIKGMWDMDRYITLLLGDIVRLRDDANGYGPCGKDYIAHVEIPENVEKAFQTVNAAYEGHIRVADSRYA